MRPPHPFSECSQLQSVYYRRREVYSLAWSHTSQEIRDYLLAAAPNGGFLALTRDPKKLVAVGKAAILKPKILVYTAAGQLVESIPVSGWPGRATFSKCSHLTFPAAQ